MGVWVGAGEGGRECVWEGVWVAGALAEVGMERVDVTSGRTCETAKRKVKERKPHVFTNKSSRMTFTNSFAKNSSRAMHQGEEGKAGRHM